jgi:hypothetical protein
LRSWLLKTASLRKLVDVSAVPVFEQVSIYPVISLLCADNATASAVEVYLPLSRNVDRFMIERYQVAQVPADWLRMLPENIWGFLLSEKLQLLPAVIEYAQPLAQFGQINATSTAAEAERFGKLLTERRPTNGIKVINTGTIDRYVAL